VRRPRIHYPGVLYHVIARENNGQNVSRQDQDYAFHLQLLKKYKHPYKFLLHVHVLMPTLPAFLDNKYCRVPSSGYGGNKPGDREGRGANGSG